MDLNFKDVVVENSYLAGILLINSSKYEKLENLMIRVYWTKGCKGVQSMCNLLFL